MIVGGGSAGCALAGRLSEDPGRRVLVLEAGPAPTRPQDYPDELREVVLALGRRRRPPEQLGFATELTDAAHRTRTPRGRVLGGSSAINGANHIRATRTDVDAWHGWTFDDALPAYIRCEDDHDVTGPGHGNAGPVPSSVRPGSSSPGSPRGWCAPPPRSASPLSPTRTGTPRPASGWCPPTSCAARGSTPRWPTSCPTSTGPT